MFRAVPLWASYASMDNSNVMTVTLSSVTPVNNLIIYRRFQSEAWRASWVATMIFTVFKMCTETFAQWQQRRPSLALVWRRCDPTSHSKGKGFTQDATCWADPKAVCMCHNVAHAGSDIWYSVHAWMRKKSPGSQDITGPRPLFS